MNLFILIISIIVAVMLFYVPSKPSNAKNLITQVFMGIFVAIILVYLFTHIPDIYQWMVKVSK